MGLFQHKRSACSPRLNSLPCNNLRSRRLYQIRLYRASVFLAIFIFIVFQFHTEMSPQTWSQEPMKSEYNGTVSSNSSNLFPISGQEETDQGGESFFEKLEYGIIKFFVGKILAAHERRQKAAANVLNQDVKTIGPEGKRIQSKPLGNTDAVDYLYPTNSSLSSNMKLTDFQNYDEGSPLSLNSTKVPHKTILLYTRFFGRRNWTGIFGNSSDLISHHCPVTNCVFTLDLSLAEEADALIFHARDFRANAIPKTRKPHQRYIWLYHEAPGMENEALNQVQDGFFNWTYTYHRDSDILLLYGGLGSLMADEDDNTTRPGLLNPSGETYKNYIEALGPSEEQSVDAILGKGLREGGKLSGANSSVKSFDGRKLVAWMVSHCSTWSGRELYIKELAQYIDVDVYGKCGTFSCGKDHHDSYCYSNVLAPNYKFYLSFENSMCKDYITEKVWYPLHYGLVPVVYGGATYRDYLPPHSYIDATNLTPYQLATLLIKIGSSSSLYNKYHLWRKYWEVIIPPPMCELCHRLHFDRTASTVKDPQRWWKDVNNCTTRYSFKDYPRQDLRLVVSKVDAGVKLFRKMLASFL